MNEHTFHIMHTRATKNDYPKCKYHIKLMPKMDGCLKEIDMMEVLPKEAGNIIQDIHAQVQLLFEKGLYYMDLNIGNVMYLKNVEKYSYYLRDINSLYKPIIPSSLKKDDIDKLLSLQIGMLYMRILSCAHNIYLNDPTKCKYKDNNYDLEKVSKDITKYNGSEQMANYLNKCNKCRPSIMDDIYTYLACTNVDVEKKCADCEKKWGPDGIQNIVCSTCTNAIKKSCCDEGNKMHYDKFGNGRRSLKDETERMKTKTHLENQMEKEMYTINTLAPNEREKNLVDKYKATSKKSIFSYRIFLHRYCSEPAQP